MRQMSQRPRGRLNPSLVDRSSFLLVELRCPRERQRPVRAQCRRAAHSLRSSTRLISSLLVQAPRARSCPPFAPLPHEFPTASASTPTAGRRALGPETASALSSPAVTSWELKRSAIDEGCTAPSHRPRPNQRCGPTAVSVPPPLRYHDPMVPRADHQPPQGSATQAQDRS